MSSHSSLLRSVVPALLLIALSLGCVLPAAAIFDSAFFNSGDSDLEITSINPAGEEVPPARQLVLRFNRPVVPVGRMERDASEIPVTITPDLACEWRWLDTSNLACQLGEMEALHPATRYTVTVRPGIKAEDGTTLRRPMTHSFVTERPRIRDYGFVRWRSPGMPVIRVRFNQPVDVGTVAHHLYFATDKAARLAAEVSAPRDRPLRDGEEFDEPESAPRSRSVWYVSPQQELPLDSKVELRIEAGVTATDGPEAGIEARTVVVFNTFPDFAFLGVQCRTNAGAELLFAPGQSPKAGQFCSPHDQVALLFSTPVAARVLGQGVKMIPVLTPVETDPEELEYDAAIAEPHLPGKKYPTFLPYWYDAYQPFTLLAAGAAIQDIFGRPLSQDIRQMVFTDHYRPTYDFAHHVAVLEKGVASEVPLEIRNLERIDLSGESLTARGMSSGLKQSLVFSEDRDKGFRVPLDLRKLLGAPSGALAGHFETIPPTANFQHHRDREFFAQITPFNVQAKVGHFNTLIWITDYASGLPVEGVETRIYRAPFPGLVANPASLAQGTSDRSGLVTLPGSEKLDPQLTSLYEWGDEKAKLFVSCRKGDDLALLPLTRDFTTGSFYDDEFGYAHLQRQYAHVRAWGMTAQGVYRAGDTIQYKLYLRNQDNRRFVPPPAGNYSLKVIDPMDQTAHEVAKLTLSEFGAYSGEFTVPANAPVGWYQFILSSDYKKSWQPMRVLVSDFTPSPFKVTTELNGELFRAGETVAVATHARLHAGGPYADAGSRVVARLFPGVLRSKNLLARDFSFDTWTENNETQTLHESEDVVDTAGDRTTTFRLDAAEVFYGQLVVESAVRDDRGKYVASEATARFVGRSRFVGLRQSDWVLQEGKPAKVEALVVNEYGEPTSGSEVKLAVRVQVTTAARVKGAGNAYLTRYEHQWVDLASFAVTPGMTTPGSATFIPDRPGLYEISATIKDTAGREHASKITRWGTGSGVVLWEGGDNNALTIIPEKQELKVGDKARYLVQNPFPGCQALITVERYGVLKSWVETFPDSTAIVEVPIEPDYVPGFYLSVTVFSPRVDKPVEGQVDLGKPAFRIGTVATKVADPYKELVVTASPERAVYKPRDKVTVDLQVAPRRKGDKLPATELAVVVLDEAVLDLIQGGKNYYDVYKGFYRLDSLDLRTYNLLMQLVGRQKFDKKGASPGGDGGADLAMRSLFKFVAYWNLSLRTDAAGKARISFELPDNLTGWRVLALAVTPGDRMGLGDGSFQVNRPTELRPALPNQVLEGDSFSAAFTVMNRTKAERTLTVKLSAEGAVAKPTTLEQKVVAPPYKRVELRLPVTTQGSGEVRLIARAYDQDDGDLTQASVPVRRQIVLETAATYGTTTASVEEKIALPTAIRTDVGGVSVNLAPTVIGNLTGAFAYLRDYPYICWEQKLTKGVMASHYLQLRPWLPADFSWSEAQGLAEVTLAQAAAHQAPNGGMVYYVPQDQYVSPYLSAYTALAFNWLRVAGHTVPPQVEAKLHAYLRELLRRDEIPSFYDSGMASTVRAVALAALAPHDRLSRADLERYRPHLLAMSLFGKAHYLQALLAVPGTEELRAEAARLIMAHANQSGGKFVFSESLSDGYLRIHASPLRDNAAILSALLAYAETPAGAKSMGDVPFKLVRTITSGRGQKDRWENTQENLFCMNALIEYSRLYEKEKPAMTVRARLDGQEFGRASFKAFTDPAITLARPFLPSDPGRSGTVRLEKEGDGRLYYAARLTWAPLALPTKPANAGMEIRREYSVERQGKWQLLSSPMTLKSGELVRVDLYLSLPAARNFVVVDDPIPGGLEPVNRDLATTSNVDADKGEVPFAGASWWFRYNDWHEYGYSFWSFYHRELRHEAARFYSEYLPAGNYHLSYVAQAIALGEFTVLPVKAEEMYDPDVFGRGVPALLKVEK